MKKSILIAVIIILTVAIAGIWYIYFNLKVPMGKSGENQFFEVIEGQGTMEIAENLKEKGFIRSPWFFAIYVNLKNASLLPGIYYLRQNMTLNEIIEPISQGNVQEYKITIPEGWRITQIAQYLTNNKIVTYADFLQAAEGKEGYLFPDTYRIAIQSTAVEIVKKMEENFTERTKDLKVNKEDLILASIVEREAKKNEDRAKITGVYLNRLDKGMKLEADPTVQYAKGNWDAPSVKDLQSVNSAYNTYLYKGLPPGPICNPGLKSIEAAVKPEKNGYYYFFHLKDGSTIFSKTAEEHQANREKYADQIAN